jgi:CheY-like chemotaxis protein
LVAKLPNAKAVALCKVAYREHYRSRNVLVVEDNVDDVKLLQVAAETAPEGVSFHVVRDGEQAMAFLNGEGQYADRHAHPFPDLVLLDISLPGVSGFEVLAWIRQHREFGRLKVFVWTDAGDPATLEKARKAGADRFVPKSMSFVRGGMAGLVLGISQAIVAAGEAQNVTAASR